jgi:hypothetical protein
MYETSTEKWWCKCPEYQNAGYHICKHLIVLYIGEEGLKSNKPRMPFYGQVWRQSNVPVLWVAGVHDESLLVVHDLRHSPTPFKPILRSFSDHVNLSRPLPAHPVPDTEFEPVHYDSDDEEEDEIIAEKESEILEPGDGEGGEFGAWNDDDDSGGLGGDRCEPETDYSQLEREGEEKVENLHLYLSQVGRLAQALESQVDRPEVSLVPDPTSTNPADMMEWANRWHDQAREREERRRALNSYYSRLQHLFEAVEDALQYEPTHRHIREIPDPTIANTPGMMNWADRWFALQNGRVRRPTWSAERRDNMFVD